MASIWLVGFVAGTAEQAQVEVVSVAVAAQVVAAAAAGMVPVLGHSVVAGMGTDFGHSVAVAGMEPELGHSVAVAVVGC